MKLSDLAGWTTGLNWYKVALYAALFLSWTGGVWGYATYQCEMKHEQDKTAKAEAKTVEVVREVEVRVPVVLKREVESAKQRAVIANLQEQLRDATKQRPENPSCDLSDAEFDSLSRLIDQTKTPK